MHFFLSAAKRGDYVMGYDMTTHPSLNSGGKVKKKYLLLTKNPNPIDFRKSYIDKKLRFDITIHFKDSGRKRLTIKKKWKVSNCDKKRIKKMTRKQIKIRITPSKH